MKKIVFALPGNETLANNIALAIQADMGDAEIRALDTMWEARES